MFGYLTAISDGQRSQLKALFIVAVTTYLTYSLLYWLTLW